MVKGGGAFKLWWENVYYVLAPKTGFSLGSIKFVEVRF
jgi:hypothetical protein